MKAFVLAAGRGTRLHPLTEHTPKPLAPVLGVPMLERVLAWLGRGGITQAAVNTHHLAPRMEAHVAARNAAWPPRLLLLHEAQLLGSGGALHGLQAFWDAPLLLWNADILCQLAPAALLQQARRQECCALLALQERPSSSFLLVDAGLRVCGLRSPRRGRAEVVRKPQGTLRALAYNGIGVLQPGLRAWLPPAGAFDLFDALLPAIARGASVQGWELPPSTFFGAIDALPKLRQLEAALRENPAFLQACTPPL